MTTETERASLLRILVSTDNHLGVWERDEIRKDDSFNSFEEVLVLANDLKVDFILLGGDLFHENKPSRSTLVKAVELISRYTLGDKPINFQVLSDQSQTFVSGCVNFEDSNINIGLPLFSIHGNHDDPSGQANLSAVDILSSCKLLNYFGKIPLGGSNIGRLTLSPVLIQKGITKLALYGLGAVRDERLGRLFQTPGCVQWVRPATTSEHNIEEWLNLFVLHQNRVQHGSTAKNCVQDKYFPEFIDLVVWGHEHECRADPEEIKNPNEAFDSTSKRFVIQPGSSVATALSEGESKGKHVVLLEVLGDKWRSIKYPLRSVRPFVWDQVVLKNQESLDPDEPEGINTFLEHKVNSMIAQAHRDNPTPAGSSPLLPLVRLRVDYTGFTTINSQRFGQKFVGKVANPHDILLWAKSAQRAVKTEDPNSEEKANSMYRPEALDQTKIEDLIASNLQQHLEILPQEELLLALHSFVEKDEKQALADCVTQVLRETQRAAATQPNLGSLAKDDEVASVVQACVQTRNANKAVSSLAEAAEEYQLKLITSTAPVGDGVPEVGLNPPSPRGFPTPAPSTSRKPPSGRAGGLRQTGLHEALTRGGRGQARNSTPATSRSRDSTPPLPSTGKTGGRRGASRTQRKRKASPEPVEAKEDEDRISDVDDDDPLPSMRTTPAAKRTHYILGSEPPASTNTRTSTRRGRHQRAAPPVVDSPSASGSPSLPDDGDVAVSLDSDDEVEDLISMDEEDPIEDDSPPPRTGPKRGGAGRKSQRGSQGGRGTPGKPARGAGRTQRIQDTPAAAPAPAAAEESYLDSDDERGGQLTRPRLVATTGRRRAPASFLGSASQSNTKGAGSSQSRSRK